MRREEMPSMEVRSLHCPNCGASLNITPATTGAICAYCGSRLEIRTGPSGQPQVMLESIKSDTSLLATKTARDHLSNELERMLPEYQQLMSQVECGSRQARIQKKQANNARFFWVLSLVGIISLAISAAISKPSDALLGGIGCLGPIWMVSFIISLSSRDEAKRITRMLETVHQPRLAKLNQEAKSIQERIDELDARMNRLAREI